MTHFEMAEKLSEKMNVTLQEATDALEACDWELLDAALLLEQQQGEKGPEAYSTRREDEEEPARGEEKTNRGAMKGVGGVLRKIFDLGRRNHFVVRKGDETILEMPVLALALLLIFAFWVCLPLLVIGLFAGFHYSFSGAELGRDSVNNAMDKAAEVAEKVKKEVTGEK